ncbi:MAG: chalcone isomerase family protein [Anaerolineales bacterium]
MFKILLFVTMSIITFSAVEAGQLAGVQVEDQITNRNGTVMKLNGMGLREKLWIDVYVGSLYLVNPSHESTDVIEGAEPFRVRMDILYSEITAKKLVAAWQEGFEKNQSQEVLAKLAARIEQFNALFSDSARKGDRILIDYVPSEGTRVLKNDKLLGTIEGEDFRKAVLAIWLGEAPADKALKAGMLGE